MKETKNLEKRQRETRQRASCRLEDGEEVKDERRRRRRRRRKTPRAEMERSSVSCRTNYRNIQEPGSAESISIRSFTLFLWLSQSSSSPPLLHPLTLFFLPFSILSYDPGGVTFGEVLPAVLFSSVCKRFLSTSREQWGRADALKYFLFLTGEQNKTLVISVFIAFEPHLIVQSLTRHFRVA